MVSKKAITMGETVKLKINNPALKGIYGEEIEVKASNGIVLDVYWRNRIKDSALDNCVEVVKPLRKIKGEK